MTVLSVQPEDSSEHKRVRVDQFPVGSVLLNELMSKLIEEVKEKTILKTKLYQVLHLSSYLTVSNI